MATEISSSSPTTAASNDRNVSISYADLIPPASILMEYEELLPGSAERLIRMAEQEQMHRHRLETESIEQDAKASRVGQTVTILVIACSVAAGIYLSLQNAEFAGAVIGGLGVLAPLITYFAYRASSGDTNSEKSVNRKEGQE